jgi:type IV fimbrial biogenesis protein FimT
VAGPRRRNGPLAGFTLVEQIAVLAVAAVLACVATPSLACLLARGRLQAAQADLIAALAHARETAVRSGMRTVMCPSRDGAHCSGDVRWEQGWLLGYDRDRDDEPDPGPILVGRALSGGVSVRSSAGRPRTGFRADGSAPGGNLTLLICRHGDPAHVLAVVVANSGRIRGSPADKRQAAACAEAA